MYYRILEYPWQKMLFCFVLIEMQSLYPDQFVALRSFVLAIWEKAAECHNLKK